jgi:peroxiredoxin family protein
MRNGYVRWALVIAALGLGVVVLTTFAGLGAVRTTPDTHGHQS